MVKKLLFFALLIPPLASFSQKKASDEMTDQLQQTVSALHRIQKESNNNTSLCRYIEQQFRYLDLAPKGENNSYRQEMRYKAGRDFHKGSFLIINGDTLKPGKDFVPLAFSANGSATGSPLIAVQERKMPWIINLDNYSLSDPEPAQALYKIARQAGEDKATAVLFYNNEDGLSPEFNGEETFPPLDIPVIFMNKAISENYFKDQTASVMIRLNVNTYDKTDTAYNLLGYLDNHAPSTLIVTASYDHPDDIAALFSLAQLLKKEKRSRQANYLFIAFSPKKKGFHPESFFMENPTLDLNKTTCLIHFEKTGQLNPDTHEVYVSGYGSSSRLFHVLHKIKSKSLSLQFEPEKKDSALLAFYEKNIPLLALSTQPDQQPGKKEDVNLKGEEEIVKYIFDVIERLNRTLK